MDDQDYVERKRLQVARLMEKLVARSEFTSNPDFIHFLSSEMVRNLVLSVVQWGLTIHKVADSSGAIRKRRFVIFTVQPGHSS